MFMCVQCGCIAWFNEPSLQNKTLKLQTRNVRELFPDLKQFQNTTMQESVNPTNHFVEQETTSKGCPTLAAEPLYAIRT